MTYAALLRLATTGSLSFALLSGCGWVDDGVGGNEPPTAHGADYEVVANERLDVSAEDGVLKDASDPGGRSVTAQPISEPAHARAFTLNPDGSFVYEHDGGTSTADSFQFAASDGIDPSEPTTVTIHIHQYPTIKQDLRYEAVPGRSLSIPAPGVLQGAEDLNGDRLSALLDQDATKGDLNLKEDGSFTYAAPITAAGDDSFSFYASDGMLASDPATVTIAFTPIARPSAAPDNYAIDVGGALNIPAPGVLENDSSPNGGSLTATLLDAPAHATVQGFALQSNGAFVYTHNGDDATADTFIYEARDLLPSEPATVTISINQPPTALDDGPYQAVSGVELRVTADQGVLANDSDPNGGTEPLQAELETAPTQGTLALAGDGRFTYTPNADASGSDTFTYRAHDKSLASEPATVTIDVAPGETEEPAAEPVEEGETL